MLLWTILVSVIKVLLVGSIAMLIAVSLWALDHALRKGAVFEAGPGPVRTRAHTPLRYWLYIVGQLLFVAAGAVMIHTFIYLGERREPPEKIIREEQPNAPVRPNDESYDRADVNRTSARITA